MRNLLTLITMLLGLASLHAQSQTTRVLWIGNSYTAGQPQNIAAMATALGVTPPATHTDIIGGATMAQRAANPSGLAALLAGIPGPIDVVVLQGQSLEATSTFSNPAAFIANVQTVFQAVRGHSPGARAVLYQTWARGAGHSFYTSGIVADPATLHTEIQTTYAQARDNLNAVFGSGSAALAPVGDAFAVTGWNPGLYAGDLSHPSVTGFTLASMVLFEAIIGSRAGEIVLDFASPLDAFASQLLSVGITESDWYALLTLVDAVDPLFPGSRDDLICTMTINGVDSPYPIRFTRIGDAVQSHVQSPNGTYVGLPLIVVVQLATGPLPPPSHGFEELVFDLTPSLLVYGPVPLPSPSLSLSGITQPGLSGTSAYLQAVSVAPSAAQGNPFFTASNAIEVRFL